MNWSAHEQRHFCRRFAGILSASFYLLATASGSVTVGAQASLPAVRRHLCRQLPARYRERFRKAGVVRRKVTKVFTTIFSPLAEAAGASE